MSRAPERSQRWLKLLHRHRVAPDERDWQHVEADIRTATEGPFCDLRRDVGALLSGDLGRLRLSFVLHAADLYPDLPPGDGVAEFLHAARADAFDGMDAALGLAADGHAVDSFLTLCETLCTWAREDREASGAKAQLRQAQARELADQRERLQPLVGRLRSASSAIAALSEEGVCDDDETRSLASQLNDLAARVEARTVAPLESRPRGKPFEKALGCALMHLFVRIGFDGADRQFTKELAALYASALAARHGIALEVHSLTTHAKKLKPER